MQRARSGLALASGAARAALRRVVEELAPALEAAFDARVVDGGWIVRIPEDRSPWDVTYRDRGGAVDDLLRLSHAVSQPKLARLAAWLMAQPAPPSGAHFCVVVTRAGGSITTLRRPGLDPRALQQARERVAALCLEQRGLLVPEGASRRRGFAIRAHQCSVCTSWAMALDERGFDLCRHTAPNASRAAVRSIGRSELCLRCLADLREAYSLARERLGLDKPVAAAAVMPRAVLPMLDRLRAQRTAAG
jgi:hypothetical protein